MALNILYIGSHASSIEKLKAHKGFNVVTYKNGLEAYRFLEDNTFRCDAVIAEINIPGIKGDDLITHSRHFTKQAIPFILISPSFNPQKKQEWLKKGITDVYLYDFNPSDVEKRITFTQSLLKQEKQSPLAFKEYKMPIIKRILDIIMAGLALLLLSPVLIIISIAIRLESKGKVYYISKRVGTGYKVFDFYKFRSMYTGADKKLKDLKHLNQYADNTSTESTVCPECNRLGYPCSTMLYIDGSEICERQYLQNRKIQNKASFVKIKDDPRVTKVGKFIRNTSIDELPQLINVFKGDMSIVGNRPLPLYEAELLTSDEWILRFMAPAGLTGLWQVMKRGKGKMSDEERKGLDNHYARKYSFWYDLKIILKTVPALFQKENV